MLNVPITREFAAYAKLTNKTKQTKNKLASICRPDVNLFITLTTQMSRRTRKIASGREGNVDNSSKHAFHSTTTRVELASKEKL